MPVPTRIVAVPHRFISGEGGALVRGMNGEANIPPGRKVRSSDFGVNGLPTLLSNAETFSQLAIAARVGPARYATVGTAGLIPHPTTGAPGVAWVAAGSTRKLAHLRADPTIAVVVRAGWRWTAVEGRAELIGPDDPHPRSTASG